MPAKRLFPMVAGTRSTWDALYRAIAKLDSEPRVEVGGQMAATYEAETQAAPNRPAASKKFKGYTGNWRNRRRFAGDFRDGRQLRGDNEIGTRDDVPAFRPSEDARGLNTGSAPAAVAPAIDRQGSCRPRRSPVAGP